MSGCEVSAETKKGARALTTAAAKSVQKPKKGASALTPAAEKTVQKPEKVQVH